MIVADANLIAYFFIQGARSELARRVGERDSDWIVPPLWRHEFANVLSVAVRKAGLASDVAISVYEKAAVLLSPGEREVSMTDVIRLATLHAVSVYDAEYAALARSLRIPLVTEDRELLKIFPDVAISMRDFLEPRPTDEAVHDRRGTYTRRKPADKSQAKNPRA